AYRETIEYMYSSNPQVIKDYAAFVGVPEPLAKKVRDDFFPKALVWPDEIKGLDSLMEEAVTLKFIPSPLTKQQQAELIQIQAARGPGRRGARGAPPPRGGEGVGVGGRVIFEKPSPPHPTCFASRLPWGEVEQVARPR